MPIKIKSIHHLSLAIAFFISLTAFGDVGNSFIMPNSGAWSFQKQDIESGISEFKGSITVKGEYLFKWDYRDDDPYELNVTFMPEGKFSESFPMARGDIRANEVRLAGSNAVLAKKLINHSEKEAAILNGNIKQVSAKVTITVENVVTGIDCNQRWYLTDLVEIIDFHTNKELVAEQ